MLCSLCLTFFSLREGLWTIMRRENIKKDMTTQLSFSLQTILDFIRMDTHLLPSI